MSDEWRAYTKLDMDYEHSIVKHKIKEYVRGNVHTNTIEGAWSHLKRSMMGTYHRPSKSTLVSIVQNMSSHITPERNRR